MAPEQTRNHAAHKLAERLSALRIVIACDPESGGETVLRHLQRSRASVRHVWPVPDVIGTDADLVICDLVPRIGRKLPWVPGEPGAALVLVLPQSGIIDLDEIQAACPDALLNRPLALPQIDVAVMLALDHFTFGKRQQARISRLEENLKAFRDIERAKQIIMKRDKTDDEGAFTVLRQLAMSRRMTVAAIAGKIIDSEDLLTYKN